jgi:hypothetical protein
MNTDNVKFMSIGEICVLMINFGRATGSRFGQVMWLPASTTGGTIPAAKAVSCR